MPAFTNDLIRTERLTLKRLRLIDARQLFEYRSLNEVTRFQRFRPQKPADTTTFIRSTATTPNISDSWYQLGVFLKDTPNLIGDIGIHFLITPDKIELGCTIAPQHWGKGYATEALTAVIFYLFKTLGKSRIIAAIDSENLRSRRLFEKLGFKLAAQVDSETTYQLDSKFSKKPHTKP